MIRVKSWFMYYVVKVFTFFKGVKDFMYRIVEVFRNVKSSLTLKFRTKGFAPFQQLKIQCFDP